MITYVKYFILICCLGYLVFSSLLGRGKRVKRSEMIQVQTKLTTIMKHLDQIEVKLKSRSSGSERASPANGSKTNKNVDTILDVVPCIDGRVGDKLVIDGYLYGKNDCSEYGVVKSIGAGRSGICMGWDKRIKLLLPRTPLAVVAAAQSQELIQ